MPARPTPEIDAAIRSEAEKNRVPYGLLFCQVRQESSFNPLAVSHCGARGLMQLMPTTGKECGLISDADFFDVEKNLHAGTGYLRRLYRACMRQVTLMPPSAKNVCVDDDYWQLGLASYNGGMGYVFKAINICYLELEPINWLSVAGYLSDDRCSVRGKHPDHKQIIDYVNKIWDRYISMKPTSAPEPESAPLPFQGRKL